MKERMVIPKDKIKVLTSCDCFPANGYFTFYKEDVEVEQVPENFADLLTLCKDTKGCFVLRASDREYIEVPTDLIGYSFTFYQDGQIFADEDVCVKEKATPQQMWNIIKNLIGE